jgi:rhodanese-related sulfurtransferase
MKRFITDNTIITIFRAIIVLLFSAGIFFKLYSYIDFVNFISEISGLGTEYALILANLILAIELYITLQFIFFNETRLTYIALLILLLIFSLFAIVLIILNNQNNCFCFGTFVEVSPVMTLIKNLILIAINIYIIRKIQFQTNKSNWLSEIILLVISIAAIQFTIHSPVDFFRDIKVQSISINQIQDMNSYIFVDARHSYIYKQQHIPNSVNIAYEGNSDVVEFDKALNKLLKRQKLEKKSIITYCGSNLCGLARSLAYSIKKRDEDANVLYLDGGIESWQTKNLQLHQH